MANETPATATNANQSTVDIDLVDANGKSLGIIVQVAVKDSDKHQKAVASVDSAFPDETPEARELLVLAKCILSWGAFSLDGEVFRYSHDNAIQFLNRFPTYRKQIQKRVERA